MKIEKLQMEDWLMNNQFAAYNLAESGTEDFLLGDFLETCNEPIGNLNHISLMNPDTRGSLPLRTGIQKCYENVELENILVTTGMTEALFAFFNTILEPGDEVIVPFPAFQTLHQLPRSIGCLVKFFNVLQCEQYIPDPGGIEKLISAKTKLIIINSPHNPTGAVIPPGIIKEIAGIAADHQIHLLFDEHYKFLPLEGGVRLIPSGFDICRGINPNVSAAGSITKCFGLNGLRVGWLIANPGIVNKCRDYKDYLTHVTPPIDDYLALVSLKNRAKLIKIKKQNILTNLVRLNTFMDKNQDAFLYVKPTGGVVCFPKLKLKMAADIFCRRLLADYNVSLLPGNVFSAGEYFRLNFAVGTETFKKALLFIQTCIEGSK